jgi:ribulose-bisphosphate carboxylase large chain
MLKSHDRFHAWYRLQGGVHEAYRKAKDICLEQTVEFPEELVPEIIRRTVMGRIEDFRKKGRGVFGARLSFPCDTTGGELSQLLNVLFGNISIKPGIRLERFELPPSLLKRFPGPRYGIPGLRRMFRAPKRPLLCTAIKPMGLSAGKLAELTYRFALGGIDIVKDDHGLADQPAARFRERVRLCVRAARAASRRTSRPCAYAPQVTGPYPAVVERALFAWREGAGALLVSPGLAGYEILQYLSCATRLPILSHPAFQGTYVLNPQSGISHHALFGQIARLAGADAAIFPNFGGRFSFSKGECREILEGAKVDMGSVKPIFPAPGGGMGLDRVPEMLRFYGRDVLFLIGGGLFKDGPDVTENARRFCRMVGGPA